VPAYRAKTPPALLRSRPDANQLDGLCGAASARAGYSGEQFGLGTTRRLATMSLIHPFRLADRSDHQTRNGSTFMGDDGYRTASRSGSQTAGPRSIARIGKAPLYWEQRDGQLACPCRWKGLHPVEPARSRCPYQLLRGRRVCALGGASGLPTEFEWGDSQHHDLPVTGNSLAHQGAAHAAGGDLERPAAADVSAMCGNGRRAPTCPIRGIPSTPRGALGEYNGKFHGEPASPCAAAPVPRHRANTRATYRNFFYPQQRWQFMGLRLASEIS